MSVQEFSQGPRFAIFSPHRRKSSVIIRYFLKQGPVAAVEAIAPIAPVLKAPLATMLQNTSTRLQMFIIDDKQCYSDTRH